MQAQDRFFEMDFRRHVTAGRLSELVGESTVETDMYIRTMGWRRVAEREFDLLEPATQRLPRGLQRRRQRLPRRTARRPSSRWSTPCSGSTGLDYEPEQWTPVDSLAWLKAMAWDLRGNMDDEIARARLVGQPHAGAGRRALPALPLRPQRADRRRPPDAAQPRRATRGRPSSAAALQALDAVRRGVDAIPDADGQRRAASAPTAGSSPASTPSRASRCWPTTRTSPPRCRASGTRWACTAARSTTTAPSTSAGFTFAGFPGVVIGHNRDIAWGMTNLDPDVTDLYLEKVAGKTYLYDGQQVPLAGARRGDPDRRRRVPKLITVRSTRHGPLLSDVSARALQRRRQRRRCRPTRPTARTATASRWRGRR